MWVIKYCQGRERVPTLSQPRARPPALQPMTCKTDEITLPSTLAERAPISQKMRDRHTPARRQSQRSPLESARSDEEAQRPRSGQAGEPLPRGLVAPLEEMYFQPEAESAICVQSFDDSLNSAIRTTYRISLRSSSLFMPRYPSTRVVYFRDTLKRTSARVRGEKHCTTIHGAQCSRSCRSRVRRCGRWSAAVISHHTHPTKPQSVKRTNNQQYAKCG